MPDTGYFFVTDLVTDLEPAELEASSFIVFLPSTTVTVVLNFPFLLAVIVFTKILLTVKLMDAFLMVVPETFTEDFLVLLGTLTLSFIFLFEFEDELVVLVEREK